MITLDFHTTFILSASNTSVDIKTDFIKNEDEYRHLFALLNASLPIKIYNSLQLE